MMNTGILTGKTNLIANNHERELFNAIFDTRIVQEFIEPHLDVIKRASVVYRVR